MASRLSRRDSFPPDVEQNRVGEEDALLRKIERTNNLLASAEKRSTEEPKDPVSFWRMTMNLTLCGLGVGILSLPYNVAGTGLINAAIWLLIVFAVQWYTIMLLIYAAEKTKIFCVEGLLELLPYGEYLKVAYFGANWTMYVLVLVSYVTVFGDYIGRVISTFSYKMGKAKGQPVPLDDSSAMKEIFAGSSFILMIAGAFIMYLLCFLKQKQLAFTSTVSIVINIFVIIAIVWNFFQQASSEDVQKARNANYIKGEEPQWMANNICLFSFSKGNIGILSALMMALVMQPVMPSMYEELEHRTPEKFSKAFLIASGLLYVIFMAFSAFSYMTYGQDIASNILNAFPDTRWYTLVSRIAMMFVVISLFPILMIPLMTPFKRNKQLKFWCTTFIVGMVLLIAMLGIDFSTLNNYNGAMSIFFLVGLCPGMIGWKMLGRNKVVMWILIALSFVATILGFMWPEPDTAAMAEKGQCWWCINPKKMTQQKPTVVFLEFVKGTESAEKWEGLLNVTMVGDCKVNWRFENITDKGKNAVLKHEIQSMQAKEARIELKPPKNIGENWSIATEKDNAGAYIVKMREKEYTISTEPPAVQIWNHSDDSPKLTTIRTKLTTIHPDGRKLSTPEQRWVIGQSGSNHCPLMFLTITKKG